MAAEKSPNASGALNLYVAFHFSESTWVNFKLFGLSGLTIVFALLQGLWLARKADNEPQADRVQGSK